MKFMPHCFMAAAAELKQGKAGAALHDLSNSLRPGVRDGVYRRGDSAPFRRYAGNLLKK